jgi:CelD/BcsL family acetyltransferase involved in cellulose biosynthesis
MEIQCVDNDGDFLSLRTDWNALWQESANPSYFLSHEWIRFCWEELRRTNTMRIFVLRNQGKPVLIAPWMRSRGLRKRLPVNVLGFIDHPESQLADVICAGTPNTEEIFAAFFRYLDEKFSTEWDVLSLNKLFKGSPIAQWLEQTRPYGSDRYPAQSCWPVLIIPLSGSWKDYLDARSPRFRKTLRNISNRVQRLGRAEVRCYRGRELSSDTIRKLFAIADASWKLTSGVAITSSPERRRFFEEVFDDPRTAEQVQVWILEVNGRPVASETQLIDGSTIYALRSDYDERHGEISPGAYLQMEILKSVFGGMHREYNFGIGLNPYKARWTDQSVDLVSFGFFNRSCYGRLLRLIEHYKLRLPHFPIGHKAFAHKGS